MPPASGRRPRRRTSYIHSVWPTTAVSIGGVSTHLSTSPTRILGNMQDDVVSPGSVTVPDAGGARPDQLLEVMGWCSFRGCRPRCSVGRRARATTPRSGRWTNTGVRSPRSTSSRRSWTTRKTGAASPPRTVRRRMCTRWAARRPGLEHRRVAGRRPAARHAVQRAAGRRRCRYERRCRRLGSHSITDPEPKFGMVVLGSVDPAQMTTNTGARPGDTSSSRSRWGWGLPDGGQARGGHRRQACRSRWTP